MKRKDNVLKCVSYKMLQKAISALDPSSNTGIGELRWWEEEGYIATKPLLPIAPLGQRGIFRSRVGDVDLDY